MIFSLEVAVIIMTTHWSRFACVQAKKKNEIDKSRSNTVHLDRLIKATHKCAGYYFVEVL